MSKDYIAVGRQDLDPKTLYIENCDKIILRDKSFDFSFDISKEIIEQFDAICVNNIKFNKEKSIQYGEWRLEVHSFYADNWDECTELRIYITARCSNCGRKHPDNYEVFHKSLYAPEDADENFRFNQVLEEQLALEKFKQKNYQFANYCPDCRSCMNVQNKRLNHN